MILLVSKFIWVTPRDSNIGKLCQSWWASNGAIHREVGKLLTLLNGNIEEVVTQHVPGELNDVADKLSRLAQPGVSQQLPPQWPTAAGPAKLARLQNASQQFRRTNGQNHVFRVFSPFCFSPGPANVVESCAETPALSSAVYMLYAIDIVAQF